MSRPSDNLLLRADHSAKCRLASTSSSDYLTEEGLPRSVRKRGRFIIPWPCPRLPPPIADVFKFVVCEKDNSNVPSKQVLEETLPVVPPDLQLLSTPPPGGVRVTWIGHATVLVQMEQITILTDPVFSTHASPIQFAGPKRYRPVPCTIHDLPHVTAVVISHNHYDHLDYNSVQVLNARFGSELRWYVPLGLEGWMRSVGCENVCQMDWWEEDSFPGHPDLTFIFTPAQHWSKRGPCDDNKVLWGSWCVVGPSSRFYFAGDTGYCGVFEQIGRKYGPFDLSAIPIGAYEPRWFLSNQHIDPQEAVLIHQDLQSKKSLAIHWGTFTLSHEYYLEPKERLAEAVKDGGLDPGEFVTIHHGDTIHVDTAHLGDCISNMHLTQQGEEKTTAYHKQQGEEKAAAKLKHSDQPQGEDKRTAKHIRQGEYKAAAKHDDEQREDNVTADRKQQGEEKITAKI